MKHINLFTVLLLCTALVRIIPQEQAAEVPTKLRASIDSTIKAVEGIRGRSFTRKVNIGIKTKKEIESLLHASFEEELDPYIRYYNTLYREFGMLHGDADLRNIYLNLLTSQIGGFYDPKEKSLFLSESYVSFSEMITAHELTHALQDCYLPLDSVLYLEDLGFNRNSKHHNDDIHLARLSLIEGEAQYVSTVYITETGLMADPDFLLKNTNADMLYSQVQLSLTPPVIVSQLMFPYTQGLNWFSSRYAGKGWDGINKSYSRLPCSTEQIIHPEKYDKDERPVFIDITIPDLKESGWNMEARNSLGEFTCSEIVKEMTGGFVKGLRAGAGWGGDSIYLFTKDKKYILIWYAVWDTEKDSKEFYTYFAEGLKKVTDGYEETGSDNALTLTGPENIRKISINGKRTLYLSASDREACTLAETWAENPEIVNWNDFIGSMKKKQKGEKND